MEQLLRPDEVARRLGVSRSWVYEAVAAGRLPAVRLGEGGPLRFSERELEGWIARSRQPAA